MTNHATLDCETYSEAGFVWDDTRGRWTGPEIASGTSKGLSAVGIWPYFEHPTADVLWVSYRLPNMNMSRRVIPGRDWPQDLFDWIASGGNIEHHNAMFERLAWEKVLAPKYGWPPLNPYQQRCSMATARVNSLPGKLENLGDVLQTNTRKDPEGKRLIQKFTMPRNPTKKDPRRRILPADDPADFERFGEYCDDDTNTEAEASARMKPMTDAELYFWLVDQEINHRGIAIDRAAVRDCITVLRQALVRYGRELEAMTGGIGPSQVQALTGWLRAHGVYMETLDADAVEGALKRTDLAPHTRRALEIRALVGSASVKKLYAMELQAGADDRLHNLIVHHGARTGRPTGEGPQPLNLPKSGPALVVCPSCAKPHRPKMDACPWCVASAPTIYDRKPTWHPETMVDPVLEIMAFRSLELVEWYFGDALLSISGCVRGLFVAAPGHDLLASDFSSIEAVVIAELAGEEWRRQAFHEGKPIYLLSASKITGRTLEEYEQYFRDNGEHHPDRQKIGKVAELGLGFGGWIGAWRQFDDTDTFSDDEVKRHILAWRDASPAILEMWGGQSRSQPWDRWDRYPELFGVEGAAVAAIQWPGQVFDFRGIKFFMRNRALIITLLSGRELTYHEPMLSKSMRPYAPDWEQSIFYMTWNSNPKYGMMGWVRMGTFGGRLTENIVQATAHDILRFAILNLRAAGYPTVLHVYDEIVVEVPAGLGSIEEVERIMATMPAWCADWPVRASGGWRGFRYRKG